MHTIFHYTRHEGNKLASIETTLTYVLSLGSFSAGVLTVLYCQLKTFLFAQY